MWRKIGRIQKNARHFFNFHQNFLNFFLVKDLTNRLLLSLFVSFWEHTFLLGCDAWKMDDHFQRPLAPISMIPNFSKKFLVKAEIPKLSSKKNLRSFHENWRRTGLSLFTLFTCSLVLKDLNEALWISNNLTNYLSLFTLFTLFNCSQGFQWSFQNLNLFGKAFEFFHFVHLVDFFLMIWMKLSESQFIWLSILVCSLCSPCSLVLKDLNEAFWIWIHRS